MSTQGIKICKRIFLSTLVILLAGGISIAGAKSAKDMFKFDKVKAKPSDASIYEEVRIEAEVSRKANAPMKKHDPDFWFKCDENDGYEKKVKRDNSREAHTHCTYTAPGTYHPEAIVVWEDDKGNDWTRSETTTVKVTAPRPSLKFSVDAGQLPNGHKTTLHWSGTNITKCGVPGGTRWLDGWFGTSGSYETPRLYGTVTYQITCAGLGGTADSSVTIKVDPPPSLPEVKGDESVKKHTGSQATINWAAANVDWYEVNLSYSPAAQGDLNATYAKEGSILGSILKKFGVIKYAEAQVAGWSNIRKTWDQFPAVDSGTRRLQFVSLGTYSFRMTGAGVAARTVSVEVLPPPSCSLFTADPDTIPAGGSSTLQWLCDRATIIDGCSIAPNVGVVEPDDGGVANEVNVSPSVTTAYRLTCDGTDMLEPVTVTVEKPGIIEVNPE